MGKTGETLEPQDQRRQSAILYEVLTLQAGERETEANGLAGFMEKKRNKLANTGHIMDDETFITHLLNSLPQPEYEGAILVIKERLRGSTCNLAQVEQLLENKYLTMKYVKDWEEEEDDYALFASPAKKGRKNSSKDDVATVERLDTKQITVLTRKARKRRTLKTNPTKKRHKYLKRIIRERAKPI